MRILQVRFNNLNSLVGEWKIDFSSPSFVSDGIFAITGPTGSGKSTILDAICLALYGRTPRLGSVTKSGNEIMSRQRGECFAEVVFETQKGCFLCHWSQHRAHKNSNGDLQNPKHEISNAQSGEIIESSIKKVAKQIESVTGMDFDRFTRSMLLAQGGFSAFLQAAPNERAPILEQITGTKIYSDISVRVHERHREEREKLTILQAETAGIMILEPEQEKEIELEVEAKQQEEIGLTAHGKKLSEALSWLRTIDGLNVELAGFVDEGRKLQSEVDSFKPERDRLNRALSAASLDGKHATLSAIRKQQRDEEEVLKGEEKLLPELESSLREKANLLELAKGQVSKAKEERKDAAPKLQKVRALDQEIANQRKNLKENEESCQKAVEKIDEDNEKKLKEEGNRSKAQDKLALIDSYLKGYQQDEWLIGGLAGIEGQLGELSARQKEIVKKESDRKKAETTLEQAIKLLSERQELSVVHKKALEESSKKLQQGKDDLDQLLEGRLLREYRVEKETLLREMAFLKKIAELEDYRAKLEDGKPCPLCGAVEHPFAEDNVPIPDETEQKIEVLSKLIGKAEEQEAAIEALEGSEASAYKKLADSEKQESVAANDSKAAETALTELKESLEILRADFIERREAVSQKLLPLGIAEVPEDDVSSLLESLRARLSSWQDHVKKKDEAYKQIIDLDSKIKSLDWIIEDQKASLAEKQQRLGSLKEEFGTVSDERKSLFCDKNPDDEELLLNKAISEAESLEERERDLHDELLQKWNTAKAHVGSLIKSIDQRGPELRELELKFLEALMSIGFSSEEQFIEAMLPPEQRDDLAQRAKDLDDLKTDLKARQKDRETRLSEEKAKNVTDKTLDELQPQIRENEEALKGLRERVIALRCKLSENTAAKEKVKEKRSSIEAQEKECRRWGNLHSLIGSADGKKYRNFAQGLTFEMMVAHANQKLHKMNDRYLLVRDEAQPLELNVIDSYQGGEVRSTKNLSGGESFIVSLSLALGLSHMASKNVRVDSLFLDEGFGTLDEEALDTALEALSGLQQDGKLIGVISHVSALKDSISTQIQVIPQTGGRSRIEGPGCCGA